MAVTPVRSTFPANVPGEAGHQVESTAAQGNKLIKTAAKIGDGTVLGKLVGSDENGVLNTREKLAKQTVANAAETTKLDAQVERLLNLFRKYLEWTEKVYAR